MPRLWTDTVAAHRRLVRDTILETAVAMAGELGLHAVTMSEVAARAGIGRATLYKYFSDVDSILLAWHERQVAGHLERLAEVSDRVGEPVDRLQAVLDAYAMMIFERPRETELAGLVHRGERLQQAEEHLLGFLTALILEAARAGSVRQDIAPEELARYCASALAAGAGLSSRAAVQRLVDMTLAGLKSAPSRPSES